MDVSVKGSGCLSQVSPNSRKAHNPTSKVEFKALIKSHLAGGRHAPVVRQFSLNTYSASFCKVGKGN